MKMRVYWKDKHEYWEVYEIINRTIFKRVTQEEEHFRGTVECAKGAHFNTIMDEYRKKYKKLEGEFKW